MDNLRLIEKFGHSIGTYSTIGLYPHNLIPTGFNYNYWKQINGYGGYYKRASV